MNPFRKLIIELAQFAVDIRAKMNPMLKQLDPLEQQEVSEPIRDLLRAVKWGVEDAERMAAAFDGKIEKLTSMADAFDAQTADIAIAASISEKKVVTAKDHEDSLTAARESAAGQAKKEAEADFDARLTASKLVADRRAEAITRVGLIAAATITDETLAGESFEASVATLEARVLKLTEENILAETREGMFSNLIAKSTEEEFTASLSLILEAAGGKLAAGKQGPKVSTSAAVHIAASTCTAKKVVI